MKFDRILNEISENSESIDKNACFPEKNLALLREEGVLGLLVPKAYGGMGCTYHEYKEWIIGIASECLSTAMILCMHCQQVATIVSYADTKLKNIVLPEIAKGDLYLGSITTDKTKGGSLSESESVIIKKEGQPHSLYRQAPIVTGGAHCDAFLIKTSEFDGNLSLIFLRKKDCKVEYKALDWNPMGMRGTESIGISLKAVFTDDAYVGEPGQFNHMVGNVFAPIGHFGWACAWYGASVNSFRRYISFSRKDQKMRENIKTHDIKLERISRIKMDLDCSYLFIEKMANLLSDNKKMDGFETQVFINEMKVFISESCFKAVDQILELSGLGLGYMKNSPIKIERCFRDLRSASLNFSNDRLVAINGVLVLATKPRLVPIWG